MPTSAIKDPGPFSSLFDYKEEQARLDQQKKQVEEAQKKIMRTNSIGDAFRLLIDAVGGSQGASIAQRPVNPAIMQASERLREHSRDYDNRSENLRLQDLRAKEMDMQYRTGLESEARKREWETDQLNKSQEFQLERDKKQSDYAKDLEILRAKHDKELVNVKGEHDLAQLQEKYKGEIEKIITKGEADIKKAGGLYVARYDDPYATEAVDRDVIIGMFKDLKQYLTDKGVYSTMQPAVLQSKDQGNISNDDLRKLIAEYPDFFAPRLPQLTGGAPLPQAPQLTPLEKRKQRYDEELEKIITNLNLSPRERARKIKSLNKNNKDILDMDLTKDTVIPASADGVTDVSSIFN